ncbi:MAG: class I SAM-dependent methyltransferase [Gammaproteobacteria bacterium]
MSYETISLLFTVSVVVNLAFLIAVRNYRRKLARIKTRNRFEKLGGGTIPVRSVYDVFLQIKRTDLGPAASTRVVHIANDHTPGGITDFESWILCNLSKSAQRIFEFGTATGKTSFLLAANSPPECEVITVTLGPGQHGDYQHDHGDIRSDSDVAISESRFTRFVYTGTQQEAKIQQLFSDSKQLRLEQYQGQVDLVFIDGSHARSYVENDTRLAMRLLRPGGVIVWHDYRGAETVPGVFETLNSMANKIKLTHLAGTSMVVYQG